MQHAGLFLGVDLEALREIEGVGITQFFDEDELAYTAGSASTYVNILIDGVVRVTVG